MRRRDPRTRPFVQTTVDLPASLLSRIKHHAVDNKTTIKSLIIAGLKQQIGEKQS